MSTATPTQLCWPANRFYWAVLDTQGWRRSGPVPPGLMAELDELIPAPLEELHAVMAPAPGGKALVCAVPTDDLRALPSDAATLSPESLPPNLDLAIEPASLNLLVGAFQPVAVTRRRARTHLRAMTLVLATAGLVTLGMVRRANWHKSRESETTVALAQVGSLDALAREVQALRSAAQSRARLDQAADARPALAGLLAAWPVSENVEVQSISARADVCTISALVKGDAAQVLAEFTPPEGWQVQEPRLAGAGDRTRLVVTLRKGEP